MAFQGKIFRRGEQFKCVGERRMAVFWPRYTAKRQAVRTGKRSSFLLLISKLQWMIRRENTACELKQEIANFFHPISSRDWTILKAGFHKTRKWHLDWAHFTVNVTYAVQTWSVLFNVLFRFQINIHGIISYFQFVTLAGHTQLGKQRTRTTSRYIYVAVNFLF